MSALSDAAEANQRLAALASAPAPAPPAAATEEPVALVFLRAGARWFALRAETVAEVATKGAITRVPGTPRTVLGLTLVRGRLVPVISLADLLGFPAAGEAAATLPRLLVLRSEDTELGVVADEIRGVIEHARPVEERGRSTERPAFLGEELAWQGRLACLIDVSALVAAVQRGAP